MKKNRSAPPGRLALALAVVLAAGCAANPPAAPQAAKEPAKESIREEAVRFRGADVELTGILFEPAATPRKGERRPAAVLLHGCSGLYTTSGRLPRSEERRVGNGWRARVWTQMEIW